MNAPAMDLHQQAKGAHRVRGASRHRRYLAKGDAAALVDLITPVTGWRRAADTIAVRLGLQFGRRHAPCDTNADWQELCAVVGEPVNALLLDTGYYKSTAFVGPVQMDDQSRAFVKVFESVEDAVSEVERASAFASHCLPDFRPADLLRRSGRVVIYELLERSGMVRGIDLEAACGAWCRRMLDRSERSASGFTPPSDLDVLSRTAGLPLTDRADAIRRLPPMPTVLAHGDLTPWNAFVDLQDRVCVVDYERLGMTTPFSDYFHLAIQPEAVHGRSPNTRALVAAVANRGGVDTAVASAWLAAYLLNELAWDLRAYVVEGRRHAQLSKLISTRNGLLGQVFDD